MRYSSKAGPTPSKSKAMKMSRTTVESTSKYSARPPQTPAIFLSVTERYSFLLIMSFSGAATGNRTREPFAYHANALPTELSRQHIEYIFSTFIGKVRYVCVRCRRL